MTEHEIAEKFLDWLQEKIITSAQGKNEDTLDLDPSGKFWLGRLASEIDVINSEFSERGERLEPCAIAIKIKPTLQKSEKLSIKITCYAWIKNQRIWKKKLAIDETIEIDLPKDVGKFIYGQEILQKSLAKNIGTDYLRAEIRIENTRNSNDELETTISFVNASPSVFNDPSPLKDTRLYECEMRVSGLSTEPYLLEALEDSFRYDRLVPAYGTNCGIEIENNSFITTDAIGVSKARPHYWGDTEEPPSFSFKELSEDSITTCNKLIERYRAWGDKVWSNEVLSKRAEIDSWSQEMLEYAKQARSHYQEELGRMEYGLKILKENKNLLRSFQLMNKAMSLGKYKDWRPFQFGFLLANLKSIVEPETEAKIADIVWFATGGGKTETYLGLLITAANYDRLTGKTSGITAWSRFPLRMLSLQQMQRFADAMAKAEIIRRENNIPGDPFSVGFFVGDGATPNSIKFESDNPNDKWVADDDNLPGRLRVLQNCPFCNTEELEMEFEREFYKVEHRCTNHGKGCPWPEKALPFYVVDDEIYRFLPTIVIGTLDKAASISRQASMRGFVGHPKALCSRNGHGYVYAQRSSRPTGCLVPDCKAKHAPLPMDEKLFAPTYRLQDELHLLKDSLGAVDSHYEALYDSLQSELSGRIPKILASSATLSGYQKQCDVLYKREGRVFPTQGPSRKEGFWSKDSDTLMRRYVAVAPRGVTIEYTVDRILTELQNHIRFLVTNPEAACKEIGIDSKWANFLINCYGTDIIYGNTLRDLDAVARSMSTQVKVEGALNTESLTGRTDFEEIRNILRRLEEPEESFDSRIHLITASSMMSHGVDIDRLNVMVMLGLPLTTAEFIQATARVGRKYPGIVFVIHKIGRERDASVYRFFEKYIMHGDRFVEPVPITKRSRRVLERTISGLVLARIAMIHEPQSQNPLTTIKNFGIYIKTGKYVLEKEIEDIVKCLDLNKDIDKKMIQDIENWLETFEQRIKNPQPDEFFLSSASHTGDPMLSLRDVEEQVKLYLDRRI